jgi:omega-6 fatty acid desaturase (delta-12 desaturase)
MVAQRPPTEKPSFTVADLRRAIPKHCFERSLWRSSLYLLVDLVAVAGLFLASQQIDKLPGPVAFRVVLWALYWFFQGAVCTGEARHGSVARWRQQRG